MRTFTPEEIVEFKALAERLLTECNGLIEDIHKLPVDALIEAYEANPEQIDATYQYITERIRNSDLSDVIGVCWRHYRKIVPGDLRTLIMHAAGQKMDWVDLANVTRKLSALLENEVAATLLNGATFGGDAHYSIRHKLHGFNYPDVLTARSGYHVADLCGCQLIDWRDKLSRTSDRWWELSAGEFLDEWRREQQAAREELVYIDVSGPLRMLDLETGVLLAGLCKLPAPATRQSIAQTLWLTAEAQQPANTVASVNEWKRRRDEFGESVEDQMATMYKDDGRVVDRTSEEIAEILDCSESAVRKRDNAVWKMYQQEKGRREALLKQKGR